MNDKENWPVNFYNRPLIKPAYSSEICKRQLMMDFPKIYVHDIIAIASFHQWQYAKTHKSLSSIMVEFENQGSDSKKPVDMLLENDDGVGTMFTVRKMVSLRSFGKRLPVLPADLQSEIDFVKSSKKNSVSEDISFILEPNSFPEKQTIECVCCFGDCEFEKMAQCMECHLVCVGCLNAYAKEIVFGTGKVQLNCMAFDCQTTYPESELRRCLEPKTWNKLEERSLEENLNMADMNDLVRCPQCDFAAILSPSIKMFKCLREDCQKAVCRNCGVDWKEHEGLTCAEIEKKDETALRKEYEEKMTKAKVRNCSSCKAQFMKDQGCNKMTCRCGITMCYICRESKIDYKHFCGHPRDPGQPCRLCKACSLWTNPEEDDERAVAEIRKEANEKRKALGFVEDKIIGAPVTPKRPLVEKNKQAPRLPNQPPAPRLPNQPPAPRLPNQPPAPRLPNQPPAPRLPNQPPAPRLPNQPPAPRLPNQPPAPRLPNQPPAPRLRNQPPAPRLPNLPQAHEAHRAGNINRNVYQPPGYFNRGQNVMQGLNGYIMDPLPPVNGLFNIFNNFPAFDPTRPPPAHMNHHQWEPHFNFAERWQNQRYDNFYEDNDYIYF
ncbi:E3 ubiquitin-protein ligase RNF216-like [Physella acuta]|uniref:E3 ubiquitin-protein ligase RNF216-like n=1 Tax=Physella acuta TaxID=109671 RepID=UPI0027DCB7B9|nr:E3 ubiquitin-protein ligase RNF216-like [Physella acuta]